MSSYNSQQWNFVLPNYETRYMIDVFDDGNETYRTHVNEWIIFAHWKGKVAVFNHYDPSIIVSSISRWKLVVI